MKLLSLFTSLVVTFLHAAPSFTHPTDTDATLISRAAKVPWRPSAGTSWQIILNKQLDTSQPLSPDVTVFLLDLFRTPASTISFLHSHGKRVICYFSAGSYEPYTPDAGKFAESDLGAVMRGWETERWADVRSENVRRIMAGRIALAREKGCDGVDPDNMDGYAHTYNDLGFTLADTRSYLRFLASATQSAGLAIGLKNCVELVADAEPITQFIVNEQCHEYAECGKFQPFVKAGKPVFNIEYPADEGGAGGRGAGTMVALSDEVGGNGRMVDVCRQSEKSGDLGFSTVVKKLALDGWVRPCGGGWQQTATH